VADRSRSGCRSPRGGCSAGRANRRELMQRAAALGIAVPGVLMSRAVPDVTAAPRAQDASPTPRSLTAGDHRR
jgi:hypothetical protein